MAERVHARGSFDVANGQPLIGIPLDENGRQVVRYFADEEAADKALAERRRHGRQQLAGAWQAIDPDIGWDEVAEQLDRIRHESKPTPPIDLDL